MAVPQPVPLFRFVHIQNLEVILGRGGMYAPNRTPNDGRLYRTIHNTDVQRSRQLRAIRCGSGGNLHDYVPFYFGYLSPMLLNLKTNRVEGYQEGQSPLIYLVSSVEIIQTVGLRFVFADGHGLAVFSKWFDRLDDLDKIDWDVVYLRYWQDTNDDPDRQRRKQAEFLVYEYCPWSVVEEIGVLNAEAANQVSTILDRFPHIPPVPVNIRPDWYYP